MSGQSGREGVAAYDGLQRVRVDAERGRRLLVDFEGIVRRRRLRAFRTDRRIDVVETARFECRRFEVAEVATDRAGIRVVGAVGTDRHGVVSLILGVGKIL